MPKPESHPQSNPADWLDELQQSKQGEVRETLGNITIALQHLDPWASACWYDVVRDMRMVGYQELSDQLSTQASLDIERETGMPMRSRHLTPTALTHLCHQAPRDLLKEMLEVLHPWDQQPRLHTWLETYAHAPKTDLNHDISRLLLVSMVARALNPGCQYRYVVVLEGPENAGKSKLVEALSTPQWYREISHGLEGKEAHMRIRRAWVAELAELASFGKTEESRLKSFFTLREDAYIPKFSNFEVTHKRRTVFIATHNPEGDETYLRGQTGNTRYLPVRVRDINIDGFLNARDALFAEALHTYHKQPDTWWQLSSAGEYEAVEIREERRQTSVYEENIGQWLERTGKQVTWWDQIAEQYLQIPKDRWADRRIQMEITKALSAIGWRKGKRERFDGALVYPWRPTDDWRVTP